MIASDIVPGPLSAAKANAEKFGMEERMEFYLSDGVASIPRDFNALVCAGMGADTIVSILTAAPWLQSSRYRLVLQCQSKTPMLRRYLSENGWRIAKETVLKDGRFLYTVMEVRWLPEYARLTPSQWYFPPALLENPSEYTAAYYRWVLEGLKIAATHRNDPLLTESMQGLEALSENKALRWLKEEVK